MLTRGTCWRSEHILTARLDDCTALEYLLVGLVGECCFGFLKESITSVFIRVVLTKNHAPCLTRDTC